MCIGTRYVCTNELSWIHLLTLLVEPPKPSRASVTDTASGVSIPGQHPPFEDAFVESPWEIHRLIILRAAEHAGLL